MNSAKHRSKNIWKRNAHPHGAQTYFVHFFLLLFPEWYSIITIYIVLKLCWFIKIYFGGKDLHIIQRQGKSFLPTAGSFFRWSQWLGLSQAKVKSQELFPGLPHGWKGGQVTEQASIAVPGPQVESWVRNGATRTILGYHQTSLCWVL